MFVFFLLSIGFVIGYTMNHRSFNLESILQGIDIQALANTFFQTANQIHETIQTRPIEKKPF